MANEQPRATPAQNEQSLLVQGELVELINRLIAEGIDWRVVLAGLGSATAATIASCAEARMVPDWFAQMAAMSAHFANGDYRGRGH